MTDRRADTDPLQVALREASQFLATQPARAAERAAAILKALPGQPQAALILGIARRIGGNPDGALQVLIPLARAQPGWAPPSYEVGVAFGLAGRRREAVAWLHRAVRLQADIGDAWRLIAEHLFALGDPAGADAAHAHQLVAATRDARLAAPATALLESRLVEAEALLLTHLAENPTDVVALRMQAEVAIRMRRAEVAAELLGRCLELAPGYVAAKYDYAKALYQLTRPAEALGQVEQLLAREPRNPAFRHLQGALLTDVGRYQEAEAVYRSLTVDHPGHAGHWTRLGDALRTTGQRDEAVAAYRQAVLLAPDGGEAYWALASVKSVHFTPDEIAAMRRQVARADLAEANKIHLRFALGQALEDAAEFGESFRHYAEGNRLHRASHPYSPERTTQFVQRSVATFTRDFFSSRQGWGCDAADPIFVIGLPRSGSTLVEQILASHSAVEGASELLNVEALVRSLVASRMRLPPKDYPEQLVDLDAEEFRELGQRYLEQTRIHRRTDAPFFVDKLPNNWEHAGLIHLMLPNARIVDVRRDPMGGCFSCFKHHFPLGQEFAYDLRDVGRYYRDYADLMAHFDAVLPGRIHRVDYRALVEDTEAEVRRLLDYCGLPFEGACLRFHENPRAVRTPSAEQVRSPIFRDALDQWRHYEAWLGPLKEALGPLAG